MEISRIIFGIIALAAVGGIGYETGARHQPPDPNVPIVRTYKVPPQRAEEIRGTLSKLFWQKDSDGSLGSAQAFGNGLLIVRAPEGFQSGIGNLVYRISQDPVAPPERGSVHLDYWLAVGEPGGKSNSESMGTLSQVLSSIEALDGPRKFRILEHLGTNSTDLNETSIKGNLVEMKSRARIVEPDQVALDLYIHSKLGEVKATTSAKSGEYIVLGENAVLDDPELLKHLKLPSGVGENQPNAYHVIRVELQK
jgi:hypothetical protein